VADGHRGEQAVDFVVDFLCKEIIRLHQKQKDLPTILAKAVEETHDAWAHHVFADKTKRKAKNPKQQKEIFDAVEKDYFDKHLDSGCTICGFILDGPTKEMYMFNLGDSRCMLYQKGYILETKDHSVPDIAEFLKGTEFEHLMITENGRMAGDLEMTHSVGDYTPELTGVIQTEPQLYDPIPIDKGAIVVLASDGLFNTDPHPTCSQDVFLNPIVDAQTLINNTVGIIDNCTAIVVKF
jgi:serine/threonine protein phosphatase PrpC